MPDIQKTLTEKILTAIGLRADLPKPPPASARKTVDGYAAAVDPYIWGNTAAVRTATTAVNSYPELDANGRYANHSLTLFRLYSEIREKDPVIHGVLEQRRAATLARPRRLIPASRSPRDLAIYQFVQQCLENIGGDDGGFDADLEHLLGAIFYGHAILEIEWQPSDKLRLKGMTSGQGAEETPDMELHGNWIIPVSLLHRYPGQFVFNADGAMLHSDGVTQAPVPPRKYILLRHGGDFENPYGIGLLQRVQWAYHFKRICMKQWVTALNRFGGPLAVATYQPGISEDERAALDTVLAGISASSGIALPDSIALKMETLPDIGDAYKLLMEYLDDCICRAVMGSTLTSSEGRRSGSLSLGQVHASVARDKVEQDSRTLAWAVNRCLIRWIVDLNFGTDAPAPQWIIDTSDEQDALSDLEIDKRLVQLGVSIPVSWFRERYLRPAPELGEPAISFDDQNLFQYHLQYGIININEARKRLGQPPVSWGEARTNAPADPFPAPSGLLVAPPSESPAPPDEPARIPQPEPAPEDNADEPVELSDPPFSDPPFSDRQWKRSAAQLFASLLRED